MRPILLVLACLMLAGPAAAAPLFLPSAPRTPYEPGDVLVVTAPGGAITATRAGLASARQPELAATLQRFGLAHAEALRQATPAVSRRVEVVRLRSDLPDFDPEAAAAALRGQPGVLAASPDLHLQLCLAPNDPFLSTQWHLGTSAAAIHAPAGWAYDTGTPDVIVAILDTGVDLEHADLYPNVWFNPYEAWDGLDNDGNAYQDDVVGWDFADHDNDPDPDPILDPSSGIDVGWHGTFVAGLAAAATNNGVGIAGVAWSSRIMALKVSKSTGAIPLSAVVSAIDYAVANGAGVINMSFGTTSSSAPGILQPMIDEANAANVVVVAAAGNSGTDTATYPAACAGVIAVASTNVSNLRSSWSNWGAYVDICAPGENVWSTIARNYAYDSYSLYAYQAYFGFDGMHAYMANSGTSFASPIVAGAAALMRSHFPGAKPADILQALVRTGDVKVYDDPIGPKLNLERALGASAGVIATAAAGTGLDFAPPAPSPAAHATTLRFTLPAAGPARLTVLDAAGRSVCVLASGERPAGPATLTWDLRDAAGRAVPAGLYFARLEAAGSMRVRRLVIVR